MSRQGLLFCHALGTPAELARIERNQLATLLIVNSHRITKRKIFTPVVARLIEPYGNEIVIRFQKIFNETSHKKRKKFFKEPIVKVYWQLFRQKKGEEINKYI